jgi:predicted nucleic acid-binding protein
LTEPNSGLLDASVFIARETGRPLGELPEHVAVSVITIGELQLGVLRAQVPARRARRADTLALARTADPIPISEAVMVTWARLVADCRVAGIHQVVKLTDALIAATAVEHGLPVVTQDDDYDRTAAATNPCASSRSDQVERESPGQRSRVRSSTTSATAGRVAQRNGPADPGGAVRRGDVVRATA